MTFEVLPTALLDKPAVAPGVVTWKSGADVSALSGRPVRLRFELKDADLYSLRFSEEP